MQDEVGDILVFLPGVGEIFTVTRLLREAGSSRSGIIVLPLHGSLSPTEQDEAIRCEVTPQTPILEARQPVLC